MCDIYIYTYENERRKKIWYLITLSGTYESSSIYRLRYLAYKKRGDHLQTYELISYLYSVFSVREYKISKSKLVHDAIN